MFRNTDIELIWFFTPIYEESSDVSKLSIFEIKSCFEVEYLQSSDVLKMRRCFNSSMYPMIIRCFFGGYLRASNLQVVCTTYTVYVHSLLRMRISTALWMFMCLIPEIIWYLSRKSTHRYVLKVAKIWINWCIDGRYVLLCNIHNRYVKQLVCRWWICIIM